MKNYRRSLRAEMREFSPCRVCEENYAPWLAALTSEACVLTLRSGSRYDAKTQAQLSPGCTNRKKENKGLQSKR